MKATNEKWRIKPRHDDEFSFMRMIHNDDDRHIVNALGVDRAHLAAAAPDLYRALELALEYWGDRQQRYKNRAPAWVVSAREALAKARGEA